MRKSTKHPKAKCEVRQCEYNPKLHYLSGIDVIMEYAPSCARVVVVLSRDFLKHEWSHYQVKDLRF